MPVTSRWWWSTEVSKHGNKQACPCCESYLRQYDQTVRLTQCCRDLEDVPDDLDRDGSRSQRDRVREKKSFEIGFEFGLIANNMRLESRTGAEGEVKEMKVCEKDLP